MRENSLGQRTKNFEDRVKNWNETVLAVERSHLLQVATAIHAACIASDDDPIANPEDSVKEAADLIDAIDEFLALRRKVNGP